VGYPEQKRREDQYKELGKKGRESENQNPDDSLYGAGERPATGVARYARDRGWKQKNVIPLARKAPSKVVGGEGRSELRIARAKSRPTQKKIAITFALDNRKRTPAFRSKLALGKN